MTKRNKMGLGEVNDGSQIDVMRDPNGEQSSYLSPTLPSAQDKSLLKSAGGAYRIRTNSKKKTAADRRRQHNEIV